MMDNKLSVQSETEKRSGLENTTVSEEEKNRCSNQQNLAAYNKEVNDGGTHTENNIEVSKIADTRSCLSGKNYDDLEKQSIAGTEASSSTTCHVRLQNDEICVVDVIKTMHSSNKISSRDSANLSSVGQRSPDHNTSKTNLQVYNNQSESDQSSAENLSDINSSDVQVDIINDSEIIHRHKMPVENETQSITDISRFTKSNVDNYVKANCNAGNSNITDPQFSNPRHPQQHSLLNRDIQQNNVNNNTSESLYNNCYSIPSAFPAPNVEIKLFVGRIPRNIEEDELRELFKLYGKVVNVSVIREKNTGIHRGAALVTMESIAQADFALRELNSIKVLDESRGPLKVQYSTGEADRLGFESESCIPGVDQVKLFVGALPKNITEDEIRELFSPYGQINEIFIMKEMHTGMGKGCAFVKYAYKEQGLYAIKTLHGALTLADVNRPIEIRFASKNHGVNNALLAHGLHHHSVAGHNHSHSHHNLHHAPLTHSLGGASSSSPGAAIKNSSSSSYQHQHIHPSHAAHTHHHHLLNSSSKSLSHSHLITDHHQQQTPYLNTSSSGSGGSMLGGHPSSCGRTIALFDHNGMAVATAASTAAMFSRSRAVGLPISSPATNATAAAAITANLMPRCIGMWKEYFTSDGKPYYHNELTQITQWEVPPEFMNFRPNFSREVVGPPGANIFIFNVPYEWDKKNLVGLFCRYGNILSAHLMVDKASGRNKGVAFVSYDNIHSAADAVNHMNGFITDQGRKLKVSIKQGQEQFVQHLLNVNKSNSALNNNNHVNSVDSHDNNNNNVINH